MRMAWIDTLTAWTLIALIALILWRVGRHLLSWAARRRGTGWQLQLADVFLPPLVSFAAIRAAQLAASPLFRECLPEWENLGLKTFASLEAAVIGWGALRIADRLDRNLRQLSRHGHGALDSLTSGMPIRVLKIAIALATALFIGQRIFDFNITALLASAGVVGLAVALAAKDTVSNFFGSLIILADTPFRIGDRIECGKVCGIVRSVGVRSSRIVTDDESVCIIPNSMLTGAVVFQRNLRGHLKRIIDLALTYDTTAEQMEQAMKILHGIMDNFHGPDRPGFEPRIFFSELGTYSLNLRAILFFKTESFAEEEALLSELNFAILRQFNAAGLKFAYPTQTLQVEHPA
ncbi:MAG: mechanosensitive ion channel family protein [Lentisphaeria bacterium]|nr:mechanosensitive ion channel family protein [Lentisphaeria bacterium]